MDLLTPPGNWPTPGELGSAIWRTQRAIERAVDAWLAPLGLSTPVFRALRLLVHQPGQSAADLARRLGLAPQSVALTVEQAESAGLVERHPHPVHGRVRQLFPTESGHAAYRRAATVISNLEQELASELGDESRTLLWHQLHAIAMQAEALTSRSAPEQTPGSQGTSPERIDAGEEP